MKSAIAGRPAITTISEFKAAVLDLCDEHGVTLDSTCFTVNPEDANFENAVDDEFDEDECPKSVSRFEKFVGKIPEWSVKLFARTPCIHPGTKLKNSESRDYIMNTCVFAAMESPETFEPLIVESDDDEMIAHSGPMALQTVFSALQEAAQEYSESQAPNLKAVPPRLAYFSTTEVRVAGSDVELHYLMMPDRHGKEFTPVQLATVDNRFFIESARDFFNTVADVGQTLINGLKNKATCSDRRAAFKQVIAPALERVGFKIVGVFADTSKDAGVLVSLRIEPNDDDEDESEGWDGFLFIAL